MSTWPIVEARRRMHLLLVIVIYFFLSLKAINWFMFFQNKLFFLFIVECCDKIICIGQHHRSEVNGLDHF